MRLASPDDLDSKQGRSWCPEDSPMQKTTCLKLILILCTFSALPTGLWSGGSELEMTYPVQGPCTGSWYNVACSDRSMGHCMIGLH